MPVGPLMLEHRLIERMIEAMDTKSRQMESDNSADLVFIEAAVDFIKTYADKCHHGKEEDILFRDLAKKGLSAEHKKIMDELVKEHILGRENVKKLIAAREAYNNGSKNALYDIITNIGILVKFYPKHIEKEDKRFFVPAMKYFTESERDAMLEEFKEFDRKLIHDRYEKIVERYE